MPLPSERPDDEERHGGQFAGWHKSCHLRVSFPTDAYVVMQDDYCSSKILEARSFSLFIFFSIYIYIVRYLGM